MKTINATRVHCTNRSKYIWVSPKGSKSQIRRMVQSMKSLSGNRMSSMRQRSLTGWHWGSLRLLEPLPYCLCQGMWTLLLLFRLCLLPRLTPSQTGEPHMTCSLSSWHSGGWLPLWVGPPLWRVARGHTSTCVVPAIKGARLACITVAFAGPNASFPGFR